MEAYKMRNHDAQVIKRTPEKQSSDMRNQFDI